MIESDGRTKKTVLSFRALLLLVLWMLGCLYVFHQRNQKKITKVQKQLHVVKQELLHRFNQDQKKRHSFLQQKSSIQQPLNMLRRLHNVNRLRVQQVLLSILSNRPPGITMTSIQVSQHRVLLRGFAWDPEHIITFLKQFRNSDIFQAVKLDRMTKTHHGFNDDKPRMKTEFVMKLLPENIQRVQQVRLPLYFLPKARNPFHPKRLAIASAGTVTTPNGPEILSKASIHNIKCVATVTSAQNPIAMLQGPKGFGHMVRPGNLLGKRKDKVVQILKDGILLERFEEGKRIPIKILRERGIQQ